MEAFALLPLPPTLPVRTWCFQEIVRIARNISASPRRSPRWQRGPHSRDGQDDGVARVVLVSVVPVGTVDESGRALAQDWPYSSRRRLFTSSQQLQCWEDIFLAKGKILLNVRFLSLSGDGWWRCLHKRNNTTELKIINIKLSLFTIVQIFFLSSLFSQTTKIMQL